MDLTKDELTKLIVETRTSAMDDIVRGLASVQPMDPTIISKLYAAGRSEKELVQSGYTPVSHHKILWIKKG